MASTQNSQLFFERDDDALYESHTQSSYVAVDDREYDASLKKYPDGSFYDFGSKQQYFRDTESLLETYPHIDVSRVGMTMSSQGGGDSASVSAQFLKAKAGIGSALASLYVPFFDMNKCASNVGSHEDKLAIAFWSHKEGVQYGFAQWRADYDNAKWMSFKGSDGKAFESRVTRPKDPVYVTFGMGDFLTIKSTSLNFLCFGSDSSVKNSPYKDYIIDLLRGHEVIVVQDNDESGRKAVFALSELLGRYVRYFNYDDSVREKEDLRDIAGRFSTQQEFIEALKSYPKIRSDKAKHKNQYGQLIIPYDGYIGDNGFLDVSTVDSGVIIAATGSGKTHPFNGTPGVLRIFPLKAGTDVETGESADYIIEKVLAEGATMTFNKFYGHYLHNIEFADMVDNKYFKLVVDEAHKLIEHGSHQNKMHHTIYNIDAVFLSGTLIHQFRDDLPHYKFVSETKNKLYYTDGKVPELGSSLMFLENTGIILKKFKDNSVISEQRERIGSCNFPIMEHNESDGDIYATSCLREGISLDRDTFSGCIVIADKCQLWTTTDYIQALQRPRADRVTRVVTKVIPEPPVNFQTKQYWKKVYTSIDDGSAVNAGSGESFSKMLRIAAGPNGYDGVNDFTLTCYINSRLREWYDTDLYSFEPLEEPYELKKAEYKRSPASMTEGMHTVEYNGKVYEMTKRNKGIFNTWKRLKEAGTVDEIMSLPNGKDAEYIHRNIKIARRMSAQHTKVMKGGRNRYAASDLFKLIRKCVSMDMFIGGMPIDSVPRGMESAIVFNITSNCPLDLAGMEMVS